VVSPQEAARRTLRLRAVPCGDVGVNAAENNDQRESCFLRGPPFISGLLRCEHEGAHAMCAWTRLAAIVGFMCAVLSGVRASSAQPRVNDFEIKLFGRYWHVASYFVQDDLQQNANEDTFLEPEGLVFDNGILYASGDRESDEAYGRLARYSRDSDGTLSFVSFLQMPSTLPDWWGPEGLTFNHSGSGYGSVADTLVSVERDTGQAGIIDLISGNVTSRVTVGNAEDVTFLPGLARFAVLEDLGTSIAVVYRDSTMAAAGQQFTAAPGTNGLVRLSASFGSWFTRTNRPTEVLLAVTKANPGNAILVYDPSGTQVGSQCNLPTSPKARIPLGGQFYMLLPAFGTVEAITVDEAGKVLFVGDESNTMIHVLTLGPPAADFNRDGDVDRYDLDQFESCGSGPAIPLSSGCEVADFDSDGDVDQVDFAMLQRCMSGEDVAADRECMD
jgi:hypothetical protein